MHSAPNSTNVNICTNECLRVSRARLCLCYFVVCLVSITRARCTSAFFFSSQTKAINWYFWLTEKLFTHSMRAETFSWRLTKWRIHFLATNLLMSPAVVIEIWKKKKTAERNTCRTFELNWVSKFSISFHPEARRPSEWATSSVEQHLHTLARWNGELRRLLHDLSNSLLFVRVQRSLCCGISRYQLLGSFGRQTNSRSSLKLFNWMKSPVLLSLRSSFVSIEKRLLLLPPQLLTIVTWYFVAATENRSATTTAQKRNNEIMWTIKIHLSKSFKVTVGAKQKHDDNSSVYMRKRVTRNRNADRNHRYHLRVCFIFSSLSFVYSLTVSISLVLLMFV